MFFIKFINTIFLFVITGPVIYHTQALVAIHPSAPLGVWKPFDPQSIFNIQRQAAFAPCSISVNAIKNKLLNKSISTVKGPWRPCFQQKNTLIRDEENESLSWNALVFSRNNKKAFMAESNWQNQQQISRITILDEQIPTTSGIHVGDSFEKIQALVDSTIPAEPDGFLSLRDKDDPDIFYVMDISRYPKLFYGVDRLSEIPGSVKVESIVVMKR